MNCGQKGQVENFIASKVWPEMNDILSPRVEPAGFRLIFLKYFSNTNTEVPSACRQVTRQKCLHKQLPPEVPPQGGRQ